MDRRRPGHPGGRRAQPVSALRVPGEDSALFDSTLQHLTERRLVTLSADDDEPVVDLGHEAMITHWPALGDWIEQSRASELKRRQIERDLVPAGSTAFRGGADKQGIEQLIGNAREWTATRADTNAAGAILLRGNWNGRDRVPAVAVVGGGYQDPALTVPRSPIPAEPNGADNETGFRCVAAGQTTIHRDMPRYLGAGRSDRFRSGSGGNFTAYVTAIIGTGTLSSPGKQSKRLLPNKTRSMTGKKSP